MAGRRRLSFFLYLLILSLVLLLLCSSLLRPFDTPATTRAPRCNLFDGRWVFDSRNPSPLYDETCPFHRNAWNCIKNKRENMGLINSWKWVPHDCGLDQIDPSRFLGLIRNRNVGFVGDSLNENFVVSLMCVLRVADSGARKWKKRGAWRGAYFPKFNVTVAYHRAVLLAKYQWQPKPSSEADRDGSKGTYRVDVDTPADEWAGITGFYDVLVFNTGHWWGYDKFPKETPLVFYRAGRPINPPLGILDGLEVVLEQMVSFIQRKFPEKTLKFWRLQSPRHFHGGDWNQNGSCLFDKPLEEHQVHLYVLEFPKSSKSSSFKPLSGSTFSLSFTVLMPRQLDLWFDPSNNGVNREVRRLNRLIKKAVQGTDIRILDLTHLSEFRADAHPAVWLGKKDAVSIWGQDCMHWCLPGVPDTWVDVLAELIRHSFETG